MLLLFALAVLRAVVLGSIGTGDLGWDAGLYVRTGARWLATGDAYYPSQLAGPYINAGDVNLYPPLALYLFVPFAWLPRVLWWIVPLAVIGSTLIWLRPARGTWPLLAATAATVPAAAAVAHGNTFLWVLTFVCLAFRWPAASVLLAFKPDAFLFALPFARRRPWWLALAAVGVAAIPFGGLWLEWVQTLGNFRGETVLYHMNDWPIILGLYLAYLARRRDLSPSPWVALARSFRVPPLRRQAAELSAE